MSTSPAGHVLAIITAAYHGYDVQPLVDELTEQEAKDALAFVCGMHLGSIQALAEMSRRSVDDVLALYGTVQCVIETRMDHDGG